MGVPRAAAPAALMVAVALLCTPPPAAAQVFQTGGLSDLMQAAMNQNPSLAAQRQLLAASREDDASALAPLLPQLSAGVDKSIRKNGESEKPREIYAAVTQQVFNLPLWSARLAGESQVAAAEARFDIAEQALREQVAGAWLDFQFAGDLVRLTEARIAVSQKQLDRARSFLERGAGTRADALAAEANLAALQADLLSQQSNRRLAQDRIYSLTGWRGRRARLAAESISELPPLAPLGEWLAQVEAKSPAIQAARADLEAAENVHDAARRAIFPRLSASAELRSSGSFSERKDTVMLRLEQLFYTGGAATSEERRLAANLAAARRSLQATSDEQALRARELHGGAALDQSRRTSLEAARAAAAASLDAAVASYEAGALVAADVLDAEEALFDARLQIRSARYDYLRGLFSLHALAGGASDEFVGQLDALFEPADEEE